MTENNGINVNTISDKYNFCVFGVSYIGKPQNNTVMYVSRKVENLLDNLSDVKECLIFAENGIEVPTEYKKENCFILTDNPQKEYALFVRDFADMKADINSKKKYTYNEEKGYWIGENVQIGQGTYIEPMVLIDHDVIIGENAYICAGSIIRNAKIGDNFKCYEKALIGIESYNLAKDDNENSFRIPSMGTIEIGNNVEIGANAIVALAATSVTQIDDYAKLDANVVIGHDSYVGKNAELATNANLGGYVYIGNNSFLAMNSVVKNRTKIGEGCFIGIGSVVIKDVEDSEEVFGVPARKIRI